MICPDVKQSYCYHTKDDYFSITVDAFLFIHQYNLPRIAFFTLKYDAYVIYLYVIYCICCGINVKQVISRYHLYYSSSLSLTFSKKDTGDFFQKMSVTLIHHMDD